MPSYQVQDLFIDACKCFMLGTLTGSRQVETRGKSMGTAIDSEPTVIDLFNELHCSKLKVLVNL